MKSELWLLPHISYLNVIWTILYMLTGFQNMLNKILHIKLFVCCQIQSVYYNHAAANGQNKPWRQRRQWPHGVDLLAPSRRHQLWWNTVQCAPDVSSPQRPGTGFCCNIFILPLLHLHTDTSTKKLNQEEFLYWREMESSSCLMVGVSQVKKHFWLNIPVIQGGSK